MALLHFNSYVALSKAALQYEKKYQDKNVIKNAGAVLYEVTDIVLQNTGID